MKREKTRVRSTRRRDPIVSDGALAPLLAGLDRRRALVGSLEPLLADLARVAAIVASAYRRSGKVLLFGNGGSHADALHLEAELIGRCTRERAPLAAIVLPGSPATLSALTNDYGHEHAYARALRALARESDVAIAFSTSGRSVNVVAALRAAREIGLATIAFTGRSGGDLAPLADVAIRVPANATPIVQEAHHLLSHLLVEAVEAELDRDVK
ncbi:MAG: SIS domain-containing protein [Planctomycetes bacterium]|nr:SIS domain-containing protein [Planctomycetota bacterium]MBI3848561.1 SIS domain-containing protein [Planctomycetota bacterium]